MLGKTTLGPRVAPVVSSSSISVEDKDNFTVEAAEAIGDLVFSSSSDDELMMVFDSCGGSGKSKLVMLELVLDGVFGGTVRSVWIHVEVI